MLNVKSDLTKTILLGTEDHASSSFQLLQSSQLMFRTKGECYCESRFLIIKDVEKSLGHALMNSLPQKWDSIFVHRMYFGSIIFLLIKESSVLSARSVVDSMPILAGFCNFYLAAQPIPWAPVYPVLWRSTRFTAFSGV